MAPLPSLFFFLCQQKIPTSQEYNSPEMNEFRWRYYWRLFAFLLVVRMTGGGHLLALSSGAERTQELNSRS